MPQWHEVAPRRLISSYPTHHLTFGIEQAPRSATSVSLRSLAVSRPLTGL